MARYILEDDPYLDSILAFLKSNEKNVGEDGQFDTLCQWPNLTQAHNMHFHPLAHIAPAIQAWIISGMPSEEIAQRYGAATNVIGWYERTFYDVRHRLEHHDYVTGVLLGDKHHNGMNERDYGLFWKFIAFVGGPIVLDAVMKRSFGVLRPKRPEDLGQFVKDATKAMLNLKTLVAVRTIQLSPLTTIPLLELWHNLAKADTASGADTGISAILKVVGEVLTGLPHAAGRSAVDYSESTMPRIAGKSVNLLAADLRAKELSQLTSTGEIPKDIDAIVYPPSPKGKKNESHLLHVGKDDD